MYNCPKCWDTPCGCGWDYLNWSRENLEKLAALLEDVKDFSSVDPFTDSQSQEGRYARFLAYQRCGVPSEQQ